MATNPPFPEQNDPDDPKKFKRAVSETCTEKHSILLIDRPSSDCIRIESGKKNIIMLNDIAGSEAITIKTSFESYINIKDSISLNNERGSSLVLEASGDFVIDSNDQQIKCDETGLSLKNSLGSIEISKEQDDIVFTLKGYKLTFREIYHWLHGGSYIP